MTESVDVAILGGGNAGYACALRAAQLGLNVILVERDKVGGTCLHRGCIPTKALLHSAEVIDHIRSAGDFGVLVGEPSVDWGKVLGYQTSVVAKLYRGLQGVIKARKVTVTAGSGVLIAPDAIEVTAAGGDKQTVHARAVVLASGSYARSLPFIDIDGEAFITSDQALTLGDLPASAIIIGAGAVGLEFASLYRSFGVDVTILEALPRLAPGEDEEVSAELTRQFRKRGIKALAGVKVTAAEATGSGASITYETSEGRSEVVTAERCLVATGRGPISEGLGYEEQGVRLERGFVVTDEWCRTGVDGLWAVGDLITQPSLGLPIPHLQLAHVAFAEGIHVAEQIAGSADPALVDYLGVPRCTYSTPEIASVGYTEAQAMQAGYDVEVARYQWAASGKASILGEPHGFVKAIAEKGGKVLGVHMIGPRVTELVAEAQLIVNWEAYPAEVAALLHPHPTLSEAVGETMLHLAGKQLHGA
ncbi:MAG TPA: dihydrolipoyl dehydrogenase [Actinomycetota bacterium]|jgi:dihydrolipoamide dehydrogenase|nr:dihydrolipoyl dehydrogenase [Actinomycetota bacterium]